MMRPTTRAAAPLALAVTALGALAGCAAAPAAPLASDALHAEPALTVARADGFVVGDTLGMSLLGGRGVMLADVSAPFELGE